MASVNYNTSTGKISSVTSNAINPGIDTTLSDFTPGTVGPFREENFTGFGPVQQFQLGNNPATSGLQNVFNQATGGTINSFNTAANRLRERLDAQGRSLGRQAQQQALGRGFGASGSLGRAQTNIDRGQQFAFGQGLSNLQSQFEGLRQQGLQTALGAQSQIGNQFLEGQGLLQRALSDENTLNSSNFNQLEDRRLKQIQDLNQLDLDQQQDINKLLLDKGIALSDLRNKANIAKSQSEAAALGALLQLYNGVQV